jgi:hypothetical protein
MGNLRFSTLWINLIVISGRWGSSFVRETYYRVDETFRVRGVARIHRHVGAARLAGIARPTVARLRRHIAVAALESGQPERAGNARRGRAKARAGE